MSTESFSSNPSPPNNFTPETVGALDSGPDGYVGVQETGGPSSLNKTISNSQAPVYPSSYNELWGLTQGSAMQAITDELVYQWVVPGSEQWFAALSAANNFVQDQWSTLDDSLSSWVILDVMWSLVSGGVIEAKTEWSTQKPSSRSWDGNPNISVLRSDASSKIAQELLYAGIAPGSSEWFAAEQALSSFLSEWAPTLSATSPVGTLANELLDIGINWATVDKIITDAVKWAMPSGWSYDNLQGTIIERSLNKTLNIVPNSVDRTGQDDWRTSLISADDVREFIADWGSSLSATSPRWVLSNELPSIVNANADGKTVWDSVRQASQSGLELLWLNVIKSDASGKTRGEWMMTARAGAELPIVESVWLNDYVKISKVYDNMSRDTGLIKISDLQNAWSAETDPVYTGSSWYSTTNNAAQWNSAYSWWNHASAGYLTDAPSDGSFYARKDWAWATVSVDLSAYSTTAAGDLRWYPLSSNPAGYLTSASAGTSFLKLDQTTPQSVINGQPDFTVGIKTYGIPITSNTVGGSPRTSIFWWLNAGAPTAYRSIALGDGALNWTATNTNGVIAIGFNAGAKNSVAYNVTNSLFIWPNSGYNSNGSNNTYIWNLSGINATGGTNTFFWPYSGSGSTGSWSAGFGSQTFASSIHNASLAVWPQAFANSNNPIGANTAVWFYAGIETSGWSSTAAFGDSAGRQSTNMQNCLIMWDSSAYWATLCGNTTFIWVNTGAYSNNVDDSAFVGSSAGQSSYNTTYTVAIGGNAFSGSTGNYNIVLGLGAATGWSYYGCFFAWQGAGAWDSISYERSSAVTGIGSSAASGLINADYLTAIGGGSASNSYYAASLVAIGTNAGQACQNARGSLMFGESVGYWSPLAANVIFIGNYAGAFDTTLDTAYRGRPRSWYIKVQSWWTLWNIDDEATITSWNSDCIVKVTGLWAGGINTVDIINAGQNYFVGDLVTVYGGNLDAIIEIASTDGDPGQIDQTNPPEIVDGGSGVWWYWYTSGETLYWPYGEPIVYVDTVDGVVWEVYDISAENNGVWYVVWDILNLQGWNYDCFVEVTSVGGSGEVTGVIVISWGSAYYSASFPAAGGSGDWLATVYVNFTYLGAVTAASWAGNGVLYYDGYNYFSSYAYGSWFYLNIVTLPYYGIPSSIVVNTIWTGYIIDWLEASTSIYSSIYNTGYWLGVQITGLRDWVVSTVSLVDAWTGGYLQWGQSNEHPAVANFGSGVDLYLLIHALTHETQSGTAICIGKYSSAGGFIDSIALWHWVQNSAIEQVNIGNVLFLEWIYNSDTPSSAPMTAGILKVWWVIQLPDYSLFTWTPTEWMTWYDFTNHYPVFYDGSNWVQI